MCTLHKEISTFLYDKMDDGNCWFLEDILLRIKDDVEELVWNWKVDYIFVPGVVVEKSAFAFQEIIVVITTN